ncbi:hypothetical protein PUN71_020920 [Arthrobacter sp. NQ7]|uniref:hypothetical protein n=1 Tax=Arthrobacter sp. NQ7 TaxID=3032303 RepID=UPI00240F8070|nr:hypothetical protein [Arthrobacter sp. NQ7]MDJ0459677.1 hypothetical protein [Arthrobacter sp. NQ7]
MSDIVTAKVFVDSSLFIKSLDERADEYRKIADSAQARGAIHHQFAVGDGFVLVIDEWESAAGFEKFFSDPELRAFMGSVGADPNVPPEVTVAKAVDAPDKF